MLEKMQDFFEKRLAGYEEHMLENIEGASDFYQFTAGQLPLKKNSKILDLGCGTGLELEEYFRRNPDAHITGIDLSSAMLKQLEKKFPHRNLRLINGSYFDVSFDDKTYNAVVSVESLHHFTEEQKLMLYQKVLHALTDDGYFILTDYFAESDELEKAYFENLEQLKKEQGIMDNESYHYDTPLTTAHEISILKAAGFSGAEILKSWGATYTIRAVR